MARSPGSLRGCSNGRSLVRMRWELTEGGEDFGTSCKLRCSHYGAQQSAALAQTSIDTQGLARQSAGRRPPKIRRRRDLPYWGWSCVIGAHLRSMTDLLKCNL
jgi:hypothetical protein